jgi:maltose phosphorylase
MKEGWYHRFFEATLQNGTTCGKHSSFLSLNLDELGCINYEIAQQDAKIFINPITNEDANWEENWNL